MRKLPHCCVLALVLGACSSEPTSPSAGILTGSVVSPQRGPLAGASVLLDAGDRSTTTDADGRYGFTGVPAGEHLLAVEASQSGCANPATVTIVQPDDESLAYDVAVECTPFGAIHGKLTGSFWGPLENVRVHTADVALYSVTSPAGDFLLERLVPGPVSLSLVGAPHDCIWSALTKSVTAGDTLALEWSLYCTGPELQFLRQMPYPDSGAVQGIQPYLPVPTSRLVRSWVIPYVGPGWANGHVPRWRFEMAPDRSAILVSNDVDLYRVPMEGATEPLLDSGADDYGASFSPSGTRFIHSVKYNQGSYSVMRDAMGGSPTELNFRHRVFYQTSYSWHPDGRQILFQSDDYDGYDYPADPTPGIRDAHIWLMNDDGSHRAQLTMGPWRDVRPVWSPDAVQIGFLSNRGGNGFEPYVMGFEGSNQRPLPGNAYWIWASGELSPLGDKLAYAAEVELDTVLGYGNSHIYIANPDGSDPELLNTGGTGTDYRPYWVR